MWKRLLLVLLILPAPASAQTASLQDWREVDSGTRRAALGLARRAFDAYVLRREVIDAPTGLPTIFHQRAAVFVSAMRGGAPRCCMGSLYPTEPDAAHEIIASAVAAAGRDRRFAPIKPAELAGLTLIVSIVAPPRSIGSGETATLDPASDGLAVKYGSRFGVVLSGETGIPDRMLRWARIRAGAKPGDSVELFRIQDVRLVESPSAVPGR